MRCERCGKEEAVVKLTRVESNGQVFQTVLCKTCAAEASPYQKKMIQNQVSMELLLKELLKTQGKVKVASEEEAAVRADVDPCPTCGLEYSAYRSTLMLGCPDCYDAFGVHLEADLKRMHRSTRHVGGAPHQSSELLDLQRTIQHMREELKEAIEMEDFERAAFLRDEIAKAEERIRSPRQEAEVIPDEGQQED